MKVLFAILLLVVFGIHLHAQMSIVEARALPIGTIVTLSGIATNGSELGNIRYFQDGTAGIAAYGSLVANVLRGDSVTITGTLKNYNQLLEMDPVTSVVVNSSSHPSPAPVVIAPSQIGEAFEAQLIQINNVDFGNLAGETFTGNTNYNFTSNGQIGTLRIYFAINLVGTVIPSVPCTLIAVVSQYNNQGNPTSGYQLMPRDTNDFVIIPKISFISPISVNTIETNLIEFSWGTDSIGTTELYYGLTSELELGHINFNSMGTIHEVSISCDPGTIIYVNAFSVDEPDTAFSGTRVFVSKSLSSGEIKVYFNQPVDTSVATGPHAISVINHFADTIIAYINQAQQTIDMIMYDNDCRAIVDALNTAYERGVQIRFITDAPRQDEAPDTVLEYLNPGIKLLAGNVDNIMHDKIMIFDRDDVNRCQVMTGSTNHTLANLNMDYNNMVIIQDQALVKAYMLEFYEMWGSTTLTPNAANAKFGSQKTDNTPHQLNIGEKRVELYFSPSDRTTSKINNALLSASDNLEFGVMAFTEDVLGNAVKTVHNQGANIRGIIDYVEYSGTEFPGLIANNINVLDYQNPGGLQYPEGATFHSKYAIVDGNQPASDPLVVTGSHNWTATADSKNDENTLIIHDAVIANLYHQAFTNDYFHLLTPVPENDLVSLFANTQAMVDFMINDFVQSQVSSTTISIFQQPSHGNAILENEIITYTPQNNFVGIDSIGYRISNGNMPDLFGDAWIKMDVIPAFNIVTNDDSVHVLFQVTKIPVKADLLGNDSIPEGIDFTFEIIQQPHYGIASYNLSDTILDFELQGFPSYHFTDTLYYRIYLNDFPSVADTAMVEIAVDIEGEITINQVINRLGIYPNPSIQEVVLRSGHPGPGNVEIINLTGETVHKQIISFNNAGIALMDCRELPSGIYLVKVRVDNSVYTAKLIKK